MNPTLKLVCIGNVDSGKSTLISVLSKNKLDNGKGIARNEIFNHPHEKETGRTSSIGMEFCKIQDRKMIFIDLCGHERYLKTTLFGLNLTKPDYCLLIIGANMGMSKMTIDHFNSAVALGLKIIICITKIDIAPKHILKKTISDIKTYCLRFRRNVLLYNENTYNANIENQEGIIPMIKLSNVTGEGINHLKFLLTKLPIKSQYSITEDTEFIIDNYYNVKGVGIVISGTIYNGKIRIGDKLFVNLQKNNQFQEVSIKSIYDDESTPVQELCAGQHCTVNIKAIGKMNLTKNDLHKGMVMISKNKCKLSNEFLAVVYIFHHQTTIKNRTEKKSGFQPVINCNGSRQCAEIVKIYNKDGILRSNDRCKVHFKFMYHNEYLTNGSKFVFREGLTRGVGQILKTELDN